VPGKKWKVHLDRDRLIVLRKVVYRDSDLIVHGLNTLGAKVNYLAPAAVKSRRRFGGGVFDPTNFIEVIYQKPAKSTGALVRLQEAQIIKEFQGLRRSYEVIQSSLSFLSLIDQIGQEGDQHGEELFNLLGHGLQYLSQKEVASLPLFRLHFLLKFLFQQGVLNLESWMHPFLQCPLREHEVLATEFSAWSNNELLDRLISVERSVQTYRETGASQ
jgi:DNA repair protein RecO (recombination protein O)